MNDMDYGGDNLMDYKTVDVSQSDNKNEIFAEKPSFSPEESVPFDLVPVQSSDPEIAETHIVSGKNRTFIFPNC